MCDAYLEKGLGGGGGCIPSQGWPLAPFYIVF